MSSNKVPISVWIAVILCGLSSTKVAGQNFDWNIVTGGASGTYIQIGRDIAKIAKEKYGLHLNVNKSDGSLENIVAVRERRHTQFGIVQSDVLDFLQTFRSTDAEIRSIIGSTRIVFPLYNEEIHILAAADIMKLEDLNGKRIGVGKNESGTHLTASFVLSTAGIDAAEKRLIGTKDALGELRAGRLDAFFYVVGAPAKLFASEVSSEDGFRLLPITDSKLASYYVSTSIPAGTYSWLKEDVPVIAVKAVLMTYEYQTMRNVYHRKSCNAVASISHIIKRELEYLQKPGNGHRKWQTVELDAIPAGWKRGECVKKGLSSNYRLPIKKQWISRNSESQPLCDKCRNQPHAPARKLCEINYCNG